MKCFVYVTKSHDPYKNLATEEYLTQYVTEHGNDECAILYLWRNEDCVVFGRNQNVNCECRLDEMKKLHIHPVRRKTGGGAVFHDLQNLNFSFIVPKKFYQRDKSMQIIKNALTSLGIPAQINGRNDIIVDGAKVSGNAYSSNESMCLHHGTLLLCVNMEIMEKILTVDEKKLESKGIKSVRSRVRNLKEYREDLSIEDYEKAIQKAFCECYHSTDTEPFEMKEDALDIILELTREYASNQWIFGYAQNSIKDVKARFTWGSCMISLMDTGEAGRYYQIFSDTLYDKSILFLQEYFDKNQEDVSIDNILPYIHDDITKLMAKDIFTLIN